MSKKLNTTFMVDYKSEIDEEHYTGAFSIHKATIGDLARIGRRQCELNGGFHNESNGIGIDLGTSNVSYMIALCETLVDIKPEWFVPTDLVDLGLLQTVAEKIGEFENSFRRKQVPGEGAAQGSTPGSTQEHTGNGSVPENTTEVVDREVPQIRKVSRV